MIQHPSRLTTIKLKRSFDHGFIHLTSNLWRKTARGIGVSGHITDFKQQVEKVSSACKVTPRTAKKYLRAAKCPLRYGIPLVNLGEALECGIDWLYSGDGLPLVMTRALADMTECEIEKFTQHVRKQFIDKDPEAMALGEKLRLGKISREEYLAAI